MKSFRSGAVKLFVFCCLSVTVGAGLAFEEGKTKYHAVGTFVEGCSCAVVCNCVFTGKFSHGCQGVGVVSLTGGSYKGVDLTGAKFAYGGVAGDRIYLYIDASETQRQAVTTVAQGLFGVVGKVIAVRSASINVSGSGGHHAITIDGGKTAQFTTEPVFGGDRKTAISHVNTILPWTIMQARTVNGSYRDGDMSFSLKDSNAFFNENVDTDLTL
jgi:hypothetical protein